MMRRFSRTPASAAVFSTAMPDGQSEVEANFSCKIKTKWAAGEKEKRKRGLRRTTKKKERGRE